MSATNEQALSISAGKVYIAEWAAITALDDTLSNAITVKSELDALSYERLSSVTDVEFAVNTSENQIKVETDDNGIIYQAYTPQAKITWNRYETGDVQALQYMLWVNVLDVAGSPASKLYGQNLTTKSLPKLVIKIVGINDSNWEKNTVYLYDAWLSGDVIQSFVDVVRAWDIKPSPFEFMGNKWWMWLVSAERF